MALQPRRVGHVASATSTYRHGLYRRDLVLHGDAFGVALWLPPTRRAGEKVAGTDWRGVITLSRLVVDPTAPRNAASFLLARSMRLINPRSWPVLLTYADTGQGHDGAIYRATGWRCDGATPGGEVWASPDGRQMGRKRGARNMTAEEMRAAGFVQQPTAMKIRYVIDRRRVKP